jgi:hypothetical protein
MSTLPLLVCALLAATPESIESVPRTPPAKRPAARLVAAQGVVRGTTATRQPFTPVVGTDFDEDDTLTVSPGAWAALVLRNRHVVRLDDDLVIRIDELALFRAPPSPTTVGAQLNRLLSPTERESAKSERLIGWHADLAAANTAPREKNSSSPAPAPPPPPPMSPAPVVAPPPPPAPDRSGSRPKVSSSESVSPERKKSQRARSDDRDEGGRFEPGEEKKKRSREVVAEEEPPREQAALATLEPDEPLRECLRSSLAAAYPEFAPTLTEVTLLITPTPGRAPVLRIKGGLTAPGCARAWVQARPRLSEGGLRELVVPLSGKAGGAAPGKQ